MARPTDDELVAGADARAAAADELDDEVDGVARPGRVELADELTLDELALEELVLDELAPEVGRGSSPAGRRVVGEDSDTG